MTAGDAVNIWLLTFVLSIGLPASQEKKPGTWVRAGELGPKPRQITDAFPLSDQNNIGNWEQYEPMSDEFDRAELDSNKWYPTNPTWLGRQPAFFYPGNVSVAGGQLHLAMKKQEVPDMPKDKGYHTYTSAAVQSKTKVKYGYFEVKAKPMKSHGSSSFWFYDSTPELWTEIDVFEVGGGAPGFERKYNMNVHVFRTPAEKNHWSVGAEWVAQSNLADDYHVYGLEWDKEKIKWYFDGVIIRWVENTHWHQPLTLNLDSETMPEWFGLPKDSELPSTYSIEYVRAWKKEGGDSRLLFSDTDLKQGFLLSYSDPTRGRDIETVLNLDNEKNKPAWRLCQWGTKYSLAGSRCAHHGNGDISYENEGKKVIVGGQNSENRDLILEIKGDAEYGATARKYGESWPHLLIEQDAVATYPLDEMEKVQFKISLKLVYFQNHMKANEYDPNLHAAQFQMFLIVKNINKQSRDYGNYFWFGVPFFDSRYEIPPVYTAKDADHKNSTGKFIYTIDGKDFNTTPLKAGNWVTIQKDLLPYIKEGLTHVTQKGHLSSSDPKDYAVVNMNLGWEIPGTFNAGIQVKDLEVSAISKKKD